MYKYAFWLLKREREQKRLEKPHPLLFYQCAVVLLISFLLFLFFIVSVIWFNLFCLLVDFIERAYIFLLFIAIAFGRDILEGKYDAVIPMYIHK